MRERLASLVQTAEPTDRLSKIYDLFMVVVAFLSMTPLMVKDMTSFLSVVDLVTVYLLFADYIFRWMTYDIVSGKKGVKAFLLYPFTPGALLPLLSLLPSIGLLGPGFRVLRMLRIFTVLHYSENFRYIAHVFRKERRTLTSVLLIALFYIFLSALVMFTYEPETFKNFYDAVYWATTALTTVGYGDMYPVSFEGKLISMISSLFGIAIIALPAGIVTASFVDELSKAKSADEAAEAKLPEAAPVSQPLFRITESIRIHTLVILLGVALDLWLNLLAQLLRLPLWLDMTGTAFTALLLGAPTGLLVGLINNMLLALLQYGDASLLYYASSAIVALLAGLWLRKYGLTPRRIILSCLIAILGCAVVNTGLDFWINAGSAPTTYWEAFYYGRLLLAGFPHVLSYFLTELVTKVYDIAATAGIVALCYALTPRPLKRKFLAYAS